MKKIAMQRCCTTPVLLRQYETSTDAVLRALGTEPVDIDGFGCCGFPLKNFNYEAYILSSAKNFSLAEREGLDVLTFCNGCYGSLKRANFSFKTNTLLQTVTRNRLKEQGLVYEGSLQIKHLLHFLYSDIGLEAISQAIKHEFENLNIATHYGCQILRPWEEVGLRQQRSPSFFDELVEITGAKSVEWNTKLDCCGAPVWGINNDLSRMLLEKKINNAKAAGAQLFCVACPFCQFQFDHVQNYLITKGQMEETLPTILYTQLLGLAMGLDDHSLGLEKNHMDISWIRDHIFKDQLPRSAIMGE